MSSTNGESHQTIVILGAGSTGLAVGLGIALNGPGRSVTIIEKDSKPGGLAGSYAWNGHLLDKGPHRLSPNLKSVRLLAKELLGPDLLIKKSQHGVQINGKCYQFPPRVIDWISIPSLWYMFSLVWSFFISKIFWITHRFQGDTFESTMVRHFGRKFYDSIARPMTRKVWTSPDQIDPSFVDQRFSQVRPSEILKKIIFPQQELNPSVFYYPRKGYQQIWDSMSDWVKREGQTLLYESQPTRIEIEGNRVRRIAFASKSGERVIETADLAVVSTIPIAGLTSIMKGYDEERLKKLAGSVKVNSMILAAFEFSQPKTLPFRTLIFPQDDVCFNRIFEQNEYSRDTVEAGKSVIIADITYPRGDARMNQPDEQILEMVKRDMGKLGYIDLSKITSASVKRIEFAYVVPDIETRKILYEINHSLKSISNLFVMGRFGAGEYDNSDYAIDDGLTMAEMITGRISKMDFLSRTNEKKDRSIVG